MTWWEQLAPRVENASAVLISGEGVHVHAIPSRLLVLADGCARVTFADGVCVVLPPIKEYV